MADRLISLLKPRTVLIWAGNSVGTGSFIAPGLILSCAHVVRSAFETGASINVQYDTSEQSKSPELETTAQVEMISSMVDGQEYPDVVILKIAHTDHPFLRLPSDQESFRYYPDREYLAIGFQKQDRQSGRNIPQTVSLNYEGEEDAGYLRKIEFKNGLIRPGMSGAPLLERENGIVTGLVQMTRSPNDALGAYIIPFEAIWEEIKNQKLSLYQKLTSKNHQKLVTRQYYREYPRFPILQEYGMRLFILPALLFFALWWFFFHLGPIEDSALVAALLIMLAFVGKLLGDWMGKEVGQESSRAKASVVKIIFHPILLAVLGVVTVLTWLFTTSIWVHGSPDTADLAVTLQQNDATKTGRTKVFNKEGIVRFLVTSSPLGDSFAIKPEGKELQMFQVKSLAKKQLYFPKDFLQEPVLILRLDPNYTDFEKYILKIQLESSGHQYIDSTLAHHTAVLIGNRKIDLDQDRINEWLRQLGLDAISGSFITDRWKDLKHHAEIDLNINETITIALIKKSDGTLTNQEVYTINDDINDKLFLLSKESPN